MRALGLPLLSGLIITDWTSTAGEKLETFCRAKKLKQLLLRIDKPSQRWTTRRGGYLIEVENSSRIVRELQQEGFISIFLEPASPFNDRYSLAAVSTPEENQFVIEVVGPGFDASDILRSDIGAHERWTVRVEDGGLNIYRTFVIDQSTYLDTVESRLLKVGARLQSPAFPREVLDSEHRKVDTLRKRAEQYLKESGQDLLLQSKNSYQPIPKQTIETFVEWVIKLLQGLAEYGIHIGPSSFSASTLPDKGLVFWDFFPAQRTEASTLYNPKQLTRGPFLK